ncbi:MAG: glycogen synthase GlgA [SAR324 cluster bacterium]|nr:glycogen synthase GlgA [SAR324 cluster bacterium]
MAEPLKIMLAISEVDGFVKTGGLADIGRSLPLALKKRGHDVRIILPYYSKIIRQKTMIPAVETLGVPMGNKELWCAVKQCFEEKVPVYLVEYDLFFARERCYDDGTYPFVDNAERFGFFSKAVLQACQALNFAPDIIHCNDWHTALLPFYLKEHEKDNPFFKKTATLLTFHNASFQGHFPLTSREFLGIGWEHFSSDRFEDFGQLNFLKGGIAWADKINAVSPGYAEELLTPLGGHGLHEMLQRRQNDVHGILNGCDYQTWNPEIDPYIPVTYSALDLNGKRTCKEELQKAFQLPRRPDIPVIGMVTRLSAQKGFEFAIPALMEILNWELQLIVLGAGEHWIEGALDVLEQQFPEKVGWKNGYDWGLAHWIEAGSDMFLMPSLFEPCGLNQMYSLKYGTLPIVRSVGGLRDTVTHFTEADGTGFVFEEPSPEALIHCVRQSVETYYEQPAAFQKLIQNAMAKQFDWENSADQYEDLYLETMKK